MRFLAERARGAAQVVEAEPQSIPRRSQSQAAQQSEPESDAGRARSEVDSAEMGRNGQNVLTGHCQGHS